MKSSPDHLTSQKIQLVTGINAFEPVLSELHRCFESEEFRDWPTVVLATTAQVSAITLFKMLPEERIEKDPLDQRSIAAVVRNIIDTHDAMALLVKPESPEEYDLHRDIMGMYLASRIAKVQSSVDPDRSEDFYPRIVDFYWEKIKRSSLYRASMNRLKGGETIFYASRRERVEKVCGIHSDFILGVLAELSAYVHSLPPPVWFGELRTLYADNQKNRDHVAIWVRITSFYLAKCFLMVENLLGNPRSEQLARFGHDHADVFEDSKE